MSAPSDHRLPHGAKRIDLGDAVVALARDKIVLTRKTATEHFTLHFGPASGVLDVHRTSMAADGSKSHETIFRIRHEDLAIALAEFGPVATKALLKVARRLDLDELVRKRIGVVVGLLTTGADLEIVTSARRGKVAIDPEKLQAFVQVPEDLNELHELEDEKFFTLVSTDETSEILGHGFAITESNGRRRLVWLPMQELNDEFERLFPLLWTAVERGLVHNGAASAT
jgi:hypothetical protein